MALVNNGHSASQGETHEPNQYIIIYHITFQGVEFKQDAMAWVAQLVIEHPI